MLSVQKKTLRDFVLYTEVLMTHMHRRWHSAQGGAFLRVPKSVHRTRLMASVWTQRGPFRLPPRRWTVGQGTRHIPPIPQALAGSQGPPAIPRLFQTARCPTAPRCTPSHRGPRGKTTGVGVVFKGTPPLPPAFTPNPKASNRPPITAPLNNSAPPPGARGGGVPDPPPLSGALPPIPEWRIPCSKGNHGRAPGTTNRQAFLGPAALGAPNWAGSAPLRLSNLTHRVL